MHIPVLLKEAIKYLSPVSGNTYIDATFGAGGYTNAILSSCNCKVISFDIDPNVQKFADETISKFGNRFSFINSNYSNINKKLSEKQINPVDGIIFDLGVSSMQLDNAERGFSFNKLAKLDMRMGNDGISAYDVINEKKESELADIIYYYGDEKKSRKIAANILKYREKSKIETTLELREIIIKSTGWNKKHQIDPATKTFQAIRIYVNDELGNLEKALCQLSSILKPGAIAVFVTFHSIEDRIVKNFFKKGLNPEIKSRYLPEISKEDLFEVITKKPIIPSDNEIFENVRSRSAKLRAYKRLQ